MFADFTRTVLIFDDRVSAADLQADPSAAACAQLAIERETDGIDRISQCLAQRRTAIASLHLVAHGTRDRLVLGQTPLDLTTLPRYASAIARWREWLTDDAEIVIYGCNVAAGSSALVAAIHELTGARVVASSTPVGASDRGGNWDLDVRIGDRDRDSAASDRDPVLFSGATRRRFRGVLLDPTGLTDAPNGFSTTDAEVSLREAIDATADGGTIELGAGVYLIEDAVSPDAGDDANQRGDFDIVGKSLTIRGAGEDQTFIDAQGLDRVFHVLSGASLTLESVTVRNGAIANDNGAGILNKGSLQLVSSTVTGNIGKFESSGGGIATESGTLRLEDSTVSGNTLTNGNHKGAGIFAQSGSLTISESTISGNVGNGSSSGGGGLAAIGLSVVVSDTTIADNTADEGGGIAVDNASVSIERATISQNNGTYAGGGILSYGSSVSISDSSISGNTGGGINSTYGPLAVADSAIVENQSPYNGGGISHLEGDLTVTNSTISGNSASNRGGGVWTAGNATFTHVTIANNSASNYGGLYNAAPGGGDYRGKIRGLTNSIISGNSSPDFANAPGNDAPVLTGVNLIADGSSSGTNVLDVDPLLEPLQQNGGGTPSHALPEDSPAIDAADPSRATEFDQRRLERDRSPDLGAFELVELFTILESAGTTKVLEGFNGAGGTGDANGIGDFYFVGLNFQPDAEVTVDLAFDNTRVALTAETLTFTPDNWDVPQFVFVAAIDDTVNTGGRSAPIAHGGNSEDLRFFVEDIQDVSVSIFDDDGTTGEVLTLTRALAYGGGNNDIYTGTDAVESIFGNAGLDLIFGRGGNDRLFGGDGGDGVSGGDGDDYVNGEAGDDFLSGGRGVDVMYGSGGNDILSGDDGNDIINGGAGDDELIGGDGDDILVGGSGNDIFTLDGLGIDTIADFQLNSDSLSLLVPDEVLDLSFRVADNTTSLFGKNGDLLVRLSETTIATLSDLSLM